jgi:hypothetical protein
MRGKSTKSTKAGWPRLTIQLPPELYALLCEQASQAHRTINSQIAFMIEHESGVKESAPIKPINKPLW